MSGYHHGSYDDGCPDCGTTDTVHTDGCRRAAKPTAYPSQQQERAARAGPQRNPLPAMWPGAHFYDPVAGIEFEVEQVTGVPGAQVISYFDTADERQPRVINRATWAELTASRYVGMPAALR